jgi:hypothetical protein
MSCFAVSITVSILLSFRASSAFEPQFSLSFLSLASWQLSFLDDVCKNRSDNSTVYEDLRQTLADCESSMLEGTQINELDYNSLASLDVEEFRKAFHS